MYSMYVHEKRAEAQSLRNSLDLASEQRGKQLKHRNEIMSQKYRSRVGQFIRQVCAITTAALTHQTLNPLDGGR